MQFSGQTQNKRIVIDDGPIGVSRPVPVQDTGSVRDRTAFRIHPLRFSIPVMQAYAAINVSAYVPAISSAVSIGRVPIPRLHYFSRAPKSTISGRPLLPKAPLWQSVQTWI